MALRQSIARYAAGDFTRRDIEKVFASALDQDPTCGEVIREYLDQQLHDRELSPSVHKDLLEQLVSHLPEDVPTETAEHVMAGVRSAAQNRNPEPPQASVEPVPPASSAKLQNVSPASSPIPSKQQKSAHVATPSPSKAAKIPAAPAPVATKIQKPVPATSAAGTSVRKSAQKLEAEAGKPDAAVSSPQLPADREKTTASPQLEPGTILRERFRLDEAVASGSMGLVFRATDLLKLEAGAISPVIAVKVINPEFANDAAALRSFQNEVANTQHLSHPNIIRLFELDKDQGHYFITMEWLEGESLDALLDRSRGSALPPVQAYAIIEQLCDALIYAHGRQVVHADVKPGNVFLTKPGELKLIDFGIARIHNPHDEPADDSQKSVALTPAYASCECLEKQTATAQDDLFSLACLIYRLLSGRRVFGTRTALQAEADGIEPVPIGGMSAQRWLALRKALAFRRADRHADVRSFADAFGQRSEPRGKLAPEPDDTPFTETANLGVIDSGEDVNLHDTGSLRALSFPIDLQDDEPVEKPARAQNGASRLEMELELPEALDAGGMVALPEPINFFDDADCDESVFVPVEQQTGRFTLESVPAIDSTVPAESRLPTESTVPTETRLPTESTVPNARIGSGTIEIEILEEPGRPPVSGPAVAPSNENADALSRRSARPPATKSLLDGDFAALTAKTAEAVAPTSTAKSAKVNAGGDPARPVSPAVKPAPAKEQATVRNAVVEALVTPVPVSTDTRPAALKLFEQVLAKPRYRAVAASVVLALFVAMFTIFSGGEDSATTGNMPLPADSIAVPLHTSTNGSGAGANDLASVQTGQLPSKVKLGNPGDVGSAVDAAAVAAVANELALPLITADTGIAIEGSAVPVPLGLPGASRAAPTQPRPAAASSTSSSTPSSTILPPVPAAENTAQPQAATDPARNTPEAAPAAAAPAPVARTEPGAQAQTTQDANANAPFVGDYNPNGPVPFSALQLAYYVEPQFPEAYAEQSIDGWVDVRFSITTDGSVDSVELLDTDLPPEFLAPSRTAVSQWRFKPFVWNGMAIAASTTVRVTYSN